MSLLRSNKYLVILLALSALAFHRWFEFSILNNGDWVFHFAESMRSWLNVAWSWNSQSGFGGVNVTASSSPILFLYGVFGFFSYNSNVADKLLFMLPIMILLPSGIYLLARYILRSSLAGFVAAVLYMSSTYFLILSTTQLTVLLADALAPLVIFLFMYSLDKDRVDTMFWALITSLVMGFYDFRVYYITAFILLGYLGFNYFAEKSSLRPKVKLSLIYFIGIVLLNSYWLLGLYSTGGISSNGIFNRGLFGGGFLNITNSFTLFHPFWTGGKPADFSVQKVPISAWVLPILVCIGLVLNRKNKRLAYFGIIACVGIFLGKQEAQPFHGAYYFLFLRFPGFDAFREASKFFLLLSLSFSVIIASLVAGAHDKGRRKELTSPILAALALGTFLINVLPLASGSIRTLYSPKRITHDYEKISEALTRGNYSRALWEPLNGEWAYSSSLHPSIGSLGLQQLSVFGSKEGDRPALASNLAIEPLSKNYSKSILSNLGIKYFFVPTRDRVNGDDPLMYYGEDRQFYLDAMDRISWLKKADIGTKEVAVYENKNYKPYFSSFANLDTFQNLDHLDQKYDFTTSQIGSDFDFVNSADSPAPNGRRVTDVFENPTSGNLVQGGLDRKMTLGQGSTLYADTAHPAISYQVSGGVASFHSAARVGPTVNGQVSTIVPARILGTAQVSGGEYWLAQGTNLSPISQTSEERTLGRVTDALSVDRASPTNLIVNPSLEQGLWQKTVGDCNNYDQSSFIEQSIDHRDSTDGKASLQLDAARHTACTGPPAIGVSGGQQLMLKFDYQVKQGKEAGYQVLFNDPAHTALKPRLDVNDGNWHTLAQAVTVPAGATSMRLLVEAFPGDANPKLGIVHYDNFRVSELTSVQQIQPATPPNYAKVLLPAGKVELAYNNPAIQGQNLILNGGFEKGLWQKTVGDCNAYDDHPELGMKQSGDAFGGSRSLQLSAKRHIACTGPGQVSVKESSSYLLSFAYQSPNASNAGYYLSFNDPAHTVYSERLPIKGKGWQQFNKQLNSPFGATSASLVLYAYSDELGTTNVINRYDDVSLRQIPNVQGEYYVVTPPKVAVTQPQKVDFTLSSPTKKLVRITGAKGPFYLAMSEAYHPQWRLELDDKKAEGSFNSWTPFARPTAVAASDHIKLDDFLNGWYVDPAKLCASGSSACTKNADGSYNLNMVAEFAPQRWFYLGSIISGLTLIGCIGYLIWIPLSKRRRRHETE